MYITKCMIKLLLHIREPYNNIYIGGLPAAHVHSNPSDPDILQDRAYPVP